MKISTDAWLEAAIDADSDEFARLITSLPPSNTQSIAASLAEGSAMESRVYALRSVSQDHSVGGDPDLAADLATIGIQFCQLAYGLFGPGEADTFVFGVGQFALDAHRAYDRMDAHEQQLEVVEKALEWLNSIEAPERFVIDLRFARIEALIEQGHLEEARDSLDAESAAGNRGHHLFGLLDQRIRDRLLSGTERKDKRSIEEQTADQKQQTLKAAIESMISIAPEFADVLEKLGSKVDEEHEIQSPSQSIMESSQIYQQLGDFLEGSAEGLGNQIRLNTSIQQVSAELADPVKGYDPASLNQARQTLEKVRQEAIESGLEDTVSDTLWPLYICYKRLKLFNEALDILQAIRTWVNQRRELIKDPLKRAGVTEQYPHLYVELAARLSEFNDSAELLSVIEESKGRALTDMLAIQAHQEELLKAPGPAANWLPELMRTLNSHYVTYLVDENITYAVCVTKKGDLYSTRLSIGNPFIEQLRSDLDPSRWGKNIGIFAAPNDVAQRLSPLVDWLGDLVDAGVLQEGDHICYSPDDLLHLVPLHYVDFRGAPFVKFVSLSRTHSATLLHTFIQKAVSQPAQYLSVKVPLAVEAEDNPDKVRMLGQVSEWFDDGPLPGAKLEDENADLLTIASQNLMNSVIHFATHGYFPRPEEAMGPFRGSGLILSENGQLPVDEKHCGLLSPERIIEQGNPMKFDDSHVTLQACVSGLSEEGVGGDALGLEWSLLMSGARSVLSTHWNIPVGSSAEFSIRFYEEWLINGQSRAKAWRSAVLSQVDENKPFEGEQVYHWAAFSLAGDWR